MDSFFQNLFSWVTLFIQIMDEDFVFTVGGFTFSLWDFEVACFLLSIIIPAIMITRSKSIDTTVSERSLKNARQWDDSQDERNVF